MTSTPIASMLRAVSTKVSPLDTLLPLPLNSRTSAERRDAARWKLMLVRVESSKNRFATTRPRKAGTFFTLRVETSEKPRAVCSTNRMSWAERSSSPST